MILNTTFLSGITGYYEFFFIISLYLEHKIFLMKTCHKNIVFKSSEKKFLQNIRLVRSHL